MSDNNFIKLCSEILKEQEQQEEQEPTQSEEPEASTDSDVQIELIGKSKVLERIYKTLSEIDNEISSKGDSKSLQLYKITSEALQILGVIIKNIANYQERIDYIIKDYIKLLAYISKSFTFKNE